MAPLDDKAKAPSQRTTVKIGANRAVYETETIHAILDAGVMCHVGYVVDGSPFVTPTLHWRVGDRLYWHGSAASRMLKKAVANPVCVTVSLLDGYVFARSAFKHSVNYRSVMLFGVPTLEEDPDAKTEVLKAMVEGLYPGRWDQLRPMTAKELKATTVLSLPIDEASAKVRTGGPMDPEEDLAHPVWAGHVPLRMVADAPVPCPRAPAASTPPEHVRAAKLPGAGPTDTVK